MLTRDEARVRAGVLVTQAILGIDAAIWYPDDSDREKVEAEIEVIYGWLRVHCAAESAIEAIRTECADGRPEESNVAPR